MLLPSLLPAFRSHSSQISLIGTRTEATEHFPAGSSAKDGKSQQKGGEQKGHPTVAKREGLDFCERPGFKTHKASSLRPNPNRKFVTNLANMHAQLQEVAHHSEKMKNHHFLTGGGNRCGIKAACLANVPNVQNSFWVPGSSLPKNMGQITWSCSGFPKPGSGSSSPLFVPPPPPQASRTTNTLNSRSRVWMT